MHKQKSTLWGEILSKVYEAGHSDGTNGITHTNIFRESDAVFEAYLETLELYLEAIGVDPSALKQELISKRAKDD